ncbi:MAG: hypothetical protein IKP20_05425 [Candidatus Methanomethylophilaceae archaeon]|nr:hypothetical protein [Candidatus Methanomethylophilaceae archaeon]
MSILVTIALIGSITAMIIGGVFVIMYLRSPSKNTDARIADLNLRTDLKQGDFIEYEVEKQGTAYSERYEIVSEEDGRYSVEKTDGTETMSAAEFLGKLRRNAQKMSGINYRDEMVPTHWGNVSCTLYEINSGKKILYIGKDGVLYKEEETDGSSKTVRTLKDTSLLG